MLDYSRVIQVIGGSFVGLGPTLPPPHLLPREQRRLLGTAVPTRRHTPESNSKSIAREVSGVDTRSSRGGGREGFGGGCIIE
jgi:hypothetical protein